MFIYDPALPDKIRQYKASQIALNIDIAPTILALAGVPIPKNMQGINLVGMIEDKIPERDKFFYQHYYLGSPHIPKEDGIITKRFKYMKFIEHDYEELYDIKSDPHETLNLVSDRKYRHVLKKLRRQYKSMKKEIR